MTKTVYPLSRKKIAGFLIVGLAILISFPVLMFRMGVDYFLMVQPIFLFIYVIVISVYVGILIATFAKSKGVSPWLWVAIAILLTLGLMIAINVIDPQYTLYGCVFVPLVSIPLTLFFIQLARQIKR